MSFTQFHATTRANRPPVALFGYFADQCKLRRVPFVIGLLALLLSTGLFVVARSFPVLVIARSLQGLSAAAVWVVGLAIIADSVPSERVGEVMGQTTIGLTWGFLFGPLIGGIIYEKFGFYATFAIPAVLIVLDVALRFALIEQPSTYIKLSSPSLAHWKLTTYTRRTTEQWRLQPCCCLTKLRHFWLSTGTERGTKWQRAIAASAVCKHW